MDYDSVSVAALQGAVSACKNSLGKDQITQMKSGAESISWNGSFAKDNLINGVEGIITKVNQIDNGLSAISSIAGMIQTYQNYTQQIKQLEAARDALRVSYWTTSYTDSEGKTHTTTHSNASEIAAKKAAYNAQIAEVKAKQDQLRVTLDSAIG